MASALLRNKRKNNSQYVMPVLGILATLVQAEDSHEDNACATENAVAAIGTICKFHGDAIQVLHQMLPLWMANLPLREDEGVLK